MNSRFAPDAAAGSIPLESRTAAMITPSYAPDFERCRLLCETVDAHVDNLSAHYILVASEDVALFRTLEGPRRFVIDERELLPHWLHSLRDPLSAFRRRIWLSLRTMPLRGWHVQQLRRIAVAGLIDDELLVFCDSDVVFLKAFDCRRFWHGDRAALFRRDGALSAGGRTEQRVWSQNAGRVLGLAASSVSIHDYIGTLIAWRRDTVREMAAHIERVHGRHWAEVIGARRRFSECMIYGRYVDDVLGGDGHVHTSEPLCHVYWDGPGLEGGAFDAFLARMTPDQVAIGIQSFTGTDVGRIRELVASR